MISDGLGQRRSARLCAALARERARSSWLVLAPQLERLPALVAPSLAAAGSEKTATDGPERLKVRCSA